VITPVDVDSFHVDTLSTQQPDNCTRFLTKHIHHVSTNATDDQQRLAIKYFGITEHKLDTHQYKVRRSFIDSACQAFNQYKLEIRSSKLQIVSTYKPGGTVIIAQGDATGRVISQDSNKYGRWSYLHLQGHDDKVITYITAYQVCKNPTNTQGITAFHQQATAFSREKRKNTNPRHKFRHNLIKFIKGLQTRGHQIIRVAYFNEHILDNNTSLQQISQQCQLLDIWKHKFPNHDEPSTYIRGSKRIVYTLISRALSPAVGSVGYKPDYRGIFINFHTEKLFGNTTNKLKSSKSRH
jgi:hypothetical protein